MLYYFKKGKNATEIQKKRFVQCVEKVLWLIKCVKSGLWSFVLEISRWMMLQGWVNQLKLIAVKSRHWEQSMLHQCKIANKLNMSKSIELWVKIKIMSFILRRKPYGLFSQPNITIYKTPRLNTQISLNLCRFQEWGSEWCLWFILTAHQRSYCFHALVALRHLAICSSCLPVLPSTATSFYHCNMAPPWQQPDTKVWKGMSKPE